jgi:CheY-like chemotaxis protein
MSRENLGSGTIRLRVLIADDDADTRLLTHTFLSLLGFDVCAATNGWEALDRATQFRPDVVILELWMPGMDGREACLRLRSGPCSPPIPIFAVTADVTRALDLPQCFDRVFTKPVDLERVAEVVLQREAALATGVAQHHTRFS